MARRLAPVSDEALDREIAEARKHSLIADPNAPRASSARYDARTGRVVIELTDGCMFAFPVSDAQGLRGASRRDLAEVEVVGDGYALHWETLDADFTVHGLLEGRLGSDMWMREHARRAGSVRSPAKARAARVNGRKGGRPLARKASSKRG